MKKNFKTSDSDINLIDLIIVIWEGKWKVLFFVVISLISGVIYQSNQGNKIKYFSASTEVDGISNNEIYKYISFNSMLIYFQSLFADKYNERVNDNVMSSITGKSQITLIKISKEKLLEFYILILSEKLLFEDAIRKYELLDRSKYNNEEDYSEAITKVASTIKIIPIIGEAQFDKNEQYRHKWVIKFRHHDFKKWKLILKYVDKSANEIIRQDIQNWFNTLITLATEQAKYDLEDLEIKIFNNKKDYERITSDKLSFLMEQSAIAYKLGIAKNTIEVQEFGDQSPILSTTINPDSPLYLRGYESIDKEIDLIKSRTNKEAFMSGLFELQKTKRRLLQDKTLKRVKILFESSPPAKKIGFSTSRIKIIATQFNYDEVKKRSFIPPMLIGLIVGVFFVIFSKSLRSQLAYRKRKKI